MPNKNIKSILEEHTNIDDNYYKTLQKINRYESKRYFNLKLSLTLLVLTIIPVIFFTIYQNNKLTSKNSNNIYINPINELYIRNLDIAIRDKKDNFKDDFKFLRELSLPSKFLEIEQYIIYKNGIENDYIIKYLSKDEGEYLNIYFSIEEDIITKFSYDKINPKLSTIANKKVYILRYQDTLILELFNEKIKLYIESNINEKEFIKLITNILMNLEEK